MRRKKKSKEFILAIWEFTNVIEEDDDFLV